MPCRLASCSPANVGPLFQQLDGPRLRLCVDLPIRRPAAQTVHDHPVPFHLHAPQQLSYPAVADAHLFRSLSLRDHALLCPLQPLQPIPFLLVHRDSFHLSSV
jgi:hypothetical protein